MVNKQIRSPGNVMRFEPEARISGDVPSAAIYTGQAYEALAGVAGGLSNKLGQMADRAAQREGQMAGLTAGQEAGAAYLQATAETAAASGAAGKGPWIEQAKALLRKEEGFRESPYWDVNAHRVGYGSDTTVTAEGKVVRVTQGMKITRDDAERDLEYRLMKREGAQVQKQLGATWDKLSDSARAGLASVGYNYGSLPKSVVAAARTGDPGAIADAVAALPANKTRRQREAALIRGGGIPAGVSSETTASIGSGQPASPPVQVAQVLPTEPLALRRDGTIYGDAYDDAAASAYSWRMEQGLSTELFNAHQQFSEDPEQFAAAVSDIRAKYAADPNLSDPRLREVFDKSFSERSEAYARDVSARRDRQLREEQQVSFAEGYDAQRIDIERQAQVLGASQQGDHIITRQVAQAASQIDRAAELGTITLDQASKFKTDLAKTAALGRIQGVFEALPTPEQKEQFALAMLDDWRQGEGPLAALPFDDVKAQSDIFRRDAREQINQRQAVSKADTSRIKALREDDIASIQETGKGLDPATGLTPERVLELSGEEGLASWQAAREKAGRIFDATNGMEAQSEADIFERLAVIKPEPGSVGYAENKEIYDAAETRATKLLKERAKDPLTQAAAGGLIALAPIDGTTDEAMTQSLQQRQMQRRIVTEVYGQDVPMFTPVEVTSLRGHLTSTDPIKQSLALKQLDYLAGTSSLVDVRQEVGEQAVQMLQDWQARVRYATDDEAAAWLKNRADPKWQEQVKPLVTKGTGEARKVTFDDVMGDLDEAWLSDPEAPADAATQRAMISDFTSLFAERYAVSQDPETARKQAVDRMKKVWGTTGVIGGRGGRLMLYPPEAFYPAVGNSHDYLRAEIDEIAAARGVDPERLSLVSDAKTQAAVNGRTRPGYLLAVVDPETGLDELLADDQGRPLRHFFDPAAVQQKLLKEAQGARDVLGQVNLQRKVNRALSRELGTWEKE
ncbi:MAG: lysozyme [Allorhizobium sp.]